MHNYIHLSAAIATESNQNFRVLCTQVVQEHSKKKVFKIMHKFST